MYRPIEEDLKRILENDPLTFERALLLENIHNPAVFKALREKLCPWSEKLQSHRYDFITPRYNTLYAAIYKYWSIIGSTPHPGSVNQSLLAAILIDWTNKGKISAEEGQALIQELTEDFYNPAMRPPPAYAQAVVGKMFAYWLNVRLTRREVAAIASEARSRPLTFDDVKQRLAQMNKMCVPEESNLVFATQVLQSKIQVAPKVGCSLRRLNAALGGGFGFGHATLIAGVNASGKTALSTQLALDFAHCGLKVVYVTTEQPPTELVARMASNVLQINYKNFTNRQDLGANTSEDREVPVIPQWIKEDLRHADKLKALDQRLSKIVFIDWSQGDGQSIANNLEDELEGQDLSPDVLIIDWIGGGLDLSRIGKTPIRQIYQQAADWGVDYAKGKRKLVIEMAQLDRSKAMGQKLCGSAMLSECKTMVNGMTNFIGISALLEPGGSEKGVFQRDQYLFVEKARDGLAGCVPVERHLQYQRFQDKGAQLAGALNA